MLQFDASRTRPRPWWAFWQPRDAAEVYGWLPDDTAESARSRASADMQRRGWQVDRFFFERRIEADFPQDDTSVRYNIRRAREATPTYNFYRPGVWARTLREDSEEPVVRGLGEAGLELDPAKVPPNLRPLLRFVTDWAIGDDVERSRFIASVPREEREAFVAAVSPHFDEIARFAGAHEQDIPVPDEVVALNLLAEAADEASTSG